MNILKRVSNLIFSSKAGGAFLVLSSLLACDPQSSGDDAQMMALLLLLNQTNSSDSAPCASRTGNPPVATFLANTITSAPGDKKTGIDDARCATDGVRGLGTNEGSLDVFSLAGSGSSASMILEWSGKQITNGADADFIVFENPFYISGNANNRFIEALIVEVSRDQLNWCGWNPDYSNASETSYSSNPTHWSRFAGINPVIYNQDTNPLSAANLFSSGGGDAFDLSDANFGSGCSAGAKNDILSTGFIYIKMTSASNVTNADTAQPFPTNNINSGADIDGVIARYATAR